MSLAVGLVELIKIYDFIVVSSAAADLAVCVIIAC